MNEGRATGLLELEWSPRRDVSIDVISRFTRALERAYNQSWLFEHADTEELLSAFGPRTVGVDTEGPRRESTHAPRYLGAGAIGRPAIPADQRLILRSVVIESPGAWEFIGQLNPLETIRKYLKDRHVRRQDRKYRESAEQDRLALENRALALRNDALAIRNAEAMTRALDNRIKLLKRADVSQEVIGSAVREMLIQPLDALDRYGDQGLIGDIKVRDFDADDESKD